jgi:hypothetical protein
MATQHRDWARGIERFPARRGKAFFFATGAERSNRGWVFSSRRVGTARKRNLKKILGEKFCSGKSQGTSFLRWDGRLVPRRVRIAAYGHEDTLASNASGRAERLFRSRQPTVTTNTLWLLIDLTSR